MHLNQATFQMVQTLIKKIKNTQERIQSFVCIYIRSTFKHGSSVESGWGCGGCCGGCGGRVEDVVVEGGAVEGRWGLAGSPPGWPASQELDDQVCLQPAQLVVASSS